LHVLKPALHRNSSRFNTSFANSLQNALMQNIPTHLNRRQAMAAAFGLVTAPCAFAQTPLYADETWQDPRRQRAVPVRIRWPQGAAPADGWPMIVYSHGLGGSREGGDVWGQAWASAGFVVLHLQHAGSDIDAVRAVASSFRDRAALRSVGGADQLLARLQDVVFALDDIARRKTIDKALRFVRADAVGMAGHSFGAHTTLGVGGQSYPGNAGIKEPRIAALIALSPTLPTRGDVAQAFAAVKQPTLCVTGTRDDDVVGNGATPDKRAAVYAALPQGNKAMLLLKDADHMTFGGVTGRAAGILPRESVTTQLQPQHHALIARITTDWWRAHLQGDVEAKARLQKPAGLAALDTWQVG
jgi:predicted dienelactone hydrolase